MKMVIKKSSKRILKDRPFADGTMTNAAFFGMLRAALRNKSRWYHSISVAKTRARVPYIGTNKRKKWMYRCEKCLKLFDDKKIKVHHEVECGSLSSFSDLEGFVTRLFCNSDKLIVLCDECHDKIHKKVKDVNSIKRTKCKDKENT